MSLGLADKETIVTDVAKHAAESVSMVVANYRGLTVAQMTALRARGRETGVHVQIVRNTLAKRALKDTEFACLDEALTGPNALFFAKNDPGAAARLVRDFSKDNEALQVNMLALDGQLLAASALASVAKLPTKDEAIAKLMSVMTGPLTKFVRTLAEPHAKLVRTLAAVRDRKQAA